MSIPYRVQVRFDSQRSVYIADVPELELSAEGATRPAAITAAEEDISGHLEMLRERGVAPPQAIDQPGEPASDELTVKVSRTLVKELRMQARLDGVEVDVLLGELLAAALVERRHDRRRRPASPNQREAGPPPPRPGQGGEDERTPGNERSRDDRRDDRRGNYAQGGQGGQGGRYHQILEDRAAFVEYVRGLDQGQARAPRRGAGGPPRSGPPGPQLRPGGRRDDRGPRDDRRDDRNPRGDRGPRDDRGGREGGG